MSNFLGQVYALPTELLSQFSYFAIANVSMFSLLYKENERKQAINLNNIVETRLQRQNMYLNSKL